MLHILYCLIIKPIEYLIEIVYVLMYRFFDDPGFAIFGVSLAISFLVLPLYIRADVIQEEESRKQKELSYWVKHIKHHFHGDEQIMILSEYYRLEKYRPIYALRGTISLLLQIPFFMAAYHYLSNLDILNGTGMWIIKDLGKEDGVLKILGRTINLLPLLMTAINLISGVVYTKGKTLREKLQVYIPAIVFLILLYHSPSGLVIYWTMNNAFSLIKNIIMKRAKNKKIFINVFLFLIGIGLLIYIFYNGKLRNAITAHDPESAVLYAIPGLVFAGIGLYRSLWQKRAGKSYTVRTDEKKAFFLTGIFLSILFGMVIPLSVISSSVGDFINLLYYRSPLYYIMTTFAFYLGVFLLWGGVIYFLLDSGKKGMYTSVLFCLSIVSLVDYFFFEAEVGTYGTRLNFEHEPHFNFYIRYGNIALIILLVLMGIWVWKKYRTLGYYMVSIVTTASVLISGVMLEKAMNDIKSLDSDINSEIVGFHLSRTGKNVVVIMLDRALGMYLPYILQEKPELREKLDGFIYYPNSVSTALKTNNGSPGLFGGYDYTTEALTQRADELMSEKHNEALRLMPEIFVDVGYHVSIADLPYAGYTYNGDFSIYDDVENVNAFHYSERVTDYDSLVMDWSFTERNLCLYSLYRCAPAMLQDNIYDHSHYLSLEKNRNYYNEGKFLREYWALEQLAEHTEIDEIGDCLMVYRNLTTHESAILNENDYTILYGDDEEREYPYEYLHREYNGIEMDLSVEGALSIYMTNMAAIIKLGEWFDYLREEGLYDNTRIILAADHGLAPTIVHGQFPQMEFSMDGEMIYVQSPNILLMQKDFYASGFTVDEQFMTNADVPAMAMEGLIQDPINHYTGNPIDFSEKEGGVNIFWSDMFEIDGNSYVPKPIDASWYHVENNIFIEENWSKLP